MKKSTIDEQRGAREEKGHGRGTQPTQPATRGTASQEKEEEEENEEEEAVCGLVHDGGWTMWSAWHGRPPHAHDPC